MPNSIKLSETSQDLLRYYDERNCWLDDGDIAPGWCGGRLNNVSDNVRQCSRCASLFIDDRPSKPKNRRGVAPRTDDEAMKVMAERKVNSPENKNDMSVEEIMAALESLPLHQQELAERLWPRIAETIKFEGGKKLAEKKAKEAAKEKASKEKLANYKPTFKNIDPNPEI